MGRVRIPYKNVTDKEAAFLAVKENITPEAIAKYKVKADFYYDDKGKNITAKGKGFELFMDFGDTELEFDLKLSMLLKPLQKMVTESLEKQAKRIV